MKKLLFILLLTVTVLPALADATWEEFKNKDKSFYVDTSSFINNESKYIYWIKTENNNGYKKMLIASDCALNLTGVQKILTYDENDKLIKTDNVKQELTIVVPDSDSYAAYNYVCNIHKKNEKKQKIKSFLNPGNIMNTASDVNNIGNDINSIRNTVRILNNHW